jgi:protocatechuate 3,4-dioxygenase alpha subunit
MTDPLDNQSPELFGQTPWQTVGPFFHYGLPWFGGADLVGDSALGARPELFAEHHAALNWAPPRGPVEGERITLVGTVIDGEGAPAPDALIEIWQADAHGRCADAAPDGFVGFGRAATDDAGGYRFHTVRPGRVPGPDGRLQAPHIAVGVLGRGLIKRLVTRVYFDGEPSNATDAVLAAVPRERRRTLLARPEGDVWRFNIILQGAGETVFFAC